MKDRRKYQKKQKEVGLAEKKNKEERISVTKLKPKGFGSEGKILEDPSSGNQLGWSMEIFVVS